ncbi:MAG: carboxypeptidase-like regulatory domain-containing protein [Acidobacteria bacterium]|nr:carboxypeptidase-like regulatory domain-containing protein [Acidobacteriota bacterium]
MPTVSDVDDGCHQHSCDRGPARVDQGLYSIIDLRPGVYTVTFTLPGFTTLVREGIELSTGVTANIDSAMAVGGIEETITVTGATPVVDVQNVRRQTAVTDETLSTLPMSTKHVNNLVTLTPGFTGLADVGGRYSSQVGGSFHGKRGTKVAFDGMGVENTSGNSSYQINAAAIEEMVLQTSGIGADTNADGPVVQLDPHAGVQPLGTGSTRTGRCRARGRRRRRAGCCWRPARR